MLLRALDAVGGSETPRLTGGVFVLVLPCRSRRCSSEFSKINDLRGESASHVMMTKKGFWFLVTAIHRISTGHPQAFPPSPTTRTRISFIGSCSFPSRVRARAWRGRARANPAARCGRVLHPGDHSFIAVLGFVLAVTPLNHRAIQTGQRHDRQSLGAPRSPAQVSIPLVRVYIPRQTPGISGLIRLGTFARRFHWVS
jgi:hypothetical protein